MGRTSLESHSTQDLLKRHPLPVVVESAPTSHAMKITMPFHLRKRIELTPTPPHGSFHHPINAEIPELGIKPRNRSIMQNRPLQGERLARRQPPLALHPVFKQFPLPTIKKAHRFSLRKSRLMLFPVISDCRFRISDSRFNS